MNIGSFIPRKRSIDAMGATIRDAMLLNMWAWVFCGSRHGSLSDRLIQALSGVPQFGQKLVCPFNG